MFLQGIVVKIDNVEWLFATNGKHTKMTMFESDEVIFESVCPLGYVNKIIKQAKQIRKYNPNSDVEFRFM